MALIEEMDRSGNWLFRWRSYLPFVFLPLIVTAWGQKTQPRTKRCEKATFKRLTGIHLSRTEVLMTSAMFLRSF